MCKGVNSSNHTFLFSKKPSSKKDSSSKPPEIFMICIALRFPDPFNLRTASTANLVKCLE